MSVSVEEFFATLGLKVHDEEFKKGESKLDKLAEKIKVGLELFGAFEVGKKLGEWVGETAEAADKSSKLAQKIGVTAEAVQELGYAAKLSDVGVDELQVSMAHLSKGLEEFYKTGKGPASDAFAALGISAKELKGESLDQNFELIADKLAKLPDGAKKTALAMDLFGRSGANLIPLLNEGQAGIVEMRNEAEELGIVVDGTTAKAFEKFNDDQTRVKAALDGIKTQVVVGLLPALQGLVTDVLAWVKANRDLIASGIKALVEGLVVAFKALVIAVAAVGKVFDFLAEHGDTATAVFTGLTVALGYFAAAAAAAWIAAAGPAILVVADIAAITYGVIKLIKHWDVVKAAARRAMRGVVDAVRSAWELIRSIPGRILDAFKGVISAIGRFFSDLFSKVENLFEGVVNRVIDGINYLLDKVPLISAQVSHVGTRGEEDAQASAALSAQFHQFNPGAFAAVPSSARAAPSFNVGNISAPITVNGAGDPAAVGDSVSKAFSSHLARELRHAQSSLGTAGGRGSG